MEHRASYLVVSPDDLEDATMSVHLSSVQPSTEGCMDSLGRFQPVNAKKQFNITAPMAFAALCASLANLARGFVLGYSSPSIPELEANGLLTNSEQSSWYGSLVTIGSLVGALISGFITHSLGRKLSTMITCLPLAFGWLAIVCGDHIAWLYLGRILTGIGNGMSSLVTSIYVSEVSSSNARGMLGTVNQVAASVGVFIVYVLPFAMDYKWLAICGGINALLTMILMTFMPETPRWLVSKGRTVEAIDNFMWLRGCDKDTAQMVILKLEEEMMKQKTSFSIRELFTPEILKPFVVSQLSMFFQVGLQDQADDLLNY
jgi:MFS family permease